jgi:thiol-disulfide isomerase/thioredoxin
MRHLKGILILLVLFGCSSNGKKPSEVATSLITGKYHPSDSLSSSLLLASYNLVPEEFNNSLIQLDSNDCFKIPISIDYPQSLTIMGRRSIGALMTNQALGLFIFPGDTLNIDLSDSISISCRNIQHQNFIQNYIKMGDLIQDARIEFPFNESVQKDSPEDFYSKRIAFRNFLRAKIQTFINENNIQDQEFNTTAFREVEYIIASDIIDYKLLNEYIYKKEVKYPKGYFSLADSLVNKVNINLITYNYFSFLNRVQILYPIEKTDTLFRLLNYDTNTLTKDILLGRSLISRLNKDSISIATNYFDIYKTRIRNPLISKAIDEQYNKKLAFINNPKARNAFLTDLSQKTGDNSVYKQIIKDHKGKVIYIKFWGPWCGPCMEELPFDKMLINQLNPTEFAFVNLCVKTKKEDWEYTISNKKMSGYHFFLNDNQYNELADLFNISGLPFHVIVGKDGKIVENNASAPGSAILNGLDQTFLNKLRGLCKTN